MNAAFSAFKNSRLFRLLEPVLYSLLAAAFIGHVFYLEGVIGMNNAALVLAGEVIGLVAPFTAAPVTAFFRRALDARKGQSADILPFVCRTPTTDRDTDQRAA